MSTRVPSRERDVGLMAQARCSARRRSTSGCDVPTISGTRPSPSGSMPGCPPLTAQNGILADHPRQSHAPETQKRPGGPLSCREGCWQVQDVNLRRLSRRFTGHDPCLSEMTSDLLPAPWTNSSRCRSFRAYSGSRFARYQLGSRPLIWRSEPEWGPSVIWSRFRYDCATVLGRGHGRRRSSTNLR